MHQKIDHKRNKHEQGSTSYWTSLFLHDLRADSKNQNGRNIRVEMPGWFVKWAMCIDLLYFQYLMLASIFNILASFQPIWWPFSKACLASLYISSRRSDCGTVLAAAWSGTCQSEWSSLCPSRKWCYRHKVPPVADSFPFGFQYSSNTVTFHICQLYTGVLDIAYTLINTRLYQILLRLRSVESFLTISAVNWHLS